MPALRTVGTVDPRPLPPPRHSARLLSGRWCDRLAPQGAALAQGAGRTAVGQTAPMLPALDAVGHNRQEKAPEKRRGRHAPGLPLLALAPMALGAADAAVTDLPEALMGQREAVGGAAQSVEALGWPRARLLGLHHPRLALEVVEAVGKPAGDLRRAHSWVQPHASLRWACGSGGQALGTADGAQGLDRAADAGVGGPQRVPSSANAPAGTTQWRGQWAWSRWSQGGTPSVAPSWPGRFGWPHWRRVWLTARNRRGRKRRLLPTRRALRA